MATHAMIQHSIAGVSPSEHRHISHEHGTWSGSECREGLPPSSTTRTTKIPSTVTVPAKRSTKAKHKKPPGMPRRPLSAYNFFYKAERVKWLEEQKEKKTKEQQSAGSSSSASSVSSKEETKKSDFLEMGKAISQRWRMLTHEDREPYDKDAKQDLVRYHQEMEAFNLSLVRSYQGPPSRPPPPRSSPQEESPLQASFDRRPDSPSGSHPDATTTAPNAEVSLANSLQLLLPLLQASAPPPSAPVDHSATTIFQSLVQQVTTQRLTQERVTEIRALLAELEQILVLQLHLEQHFAPRPVAATPEGGVNEACSALLSLVSRLR